MAVLAAAHVRRFGMEPKIALVSHSDFGSYDERLVAQDASGARDRLTAQASGPRDRRRDARRLRAGSGVARARVFPHSRLKGEANVLIMPNLDAANIAYQMIKVLGGRAAGRPDSDRRGAAGAHPHAVGTARGVVNMTAIAAVEAQQAAEAQLPLGFT